MIPPGRPRRPGTGGRPSRASGWVVSLAVVVALAVAACAGAGGTPGPSAASQAPASGASSGGTRPPGAAPTNWPSPVVLAAIGLAQADGDFPKMNKDVTDAVNASDPARMLTAMQDALAFLQGNLDNVQRLQGYAETKPLGDQLAAAYGQMIAGAKLAIDGLSNGKGDEVTNGFNQFFAGDSAYAATTGTLADIANQALQMQKHLNE